jgi:RWP-RK domain
LHMQEDDDGPAATPSAEKSLRTRRTTTGKVKGRGKAPKASASKTRKARCSMADDDDEELDEAEFRKKVQSVFHLPIADAATSLGLGVTVLKKRCRRINIPRWPYRKLASIEKLIESVEKVTSEYPLMPPVGMKHNAASMRKLQLPVPGTYLC